MVVVIVVGLLLMVSAGAFAGTLIADNVSAPAIYTPHLLGHVLPALSPVAIFCAGLGLGFLLWLGLWIAASAVDRWRERHPDDPADSFLPGRWRPS